MQIRENGYAPIEAYGAIGNLHTVALVARDGAVDWCCLPRLDSPSAFAALLDARRGGTFRVHPSERGALPEQRYLERTNVLEAKWRRGDALLRVTDWMPVRGDLEEGEASEEDPVLVRRIRCEEAAADVVVEWVPRLDYARGKTEIGGGDHGFTARHERCDPVRLLGLPGGEVTDAVDGGPMVRTVLKLRPGDEVALVMAWGKTEPSVDRARGSLEETCAAWRAWVDHDGGCEWAGKAAPLVRRSQLALKLLTQPGNGAIAAAATTSLPEWIGGSRNWDYRYSWIRDASLTAQALIVLGHTGDASAFLHWMEEMAAEHEKDELLPIMFTLDGGLEIEEDELGHLDGYRGSRPVRIGNGAADQLQLDVFGELLGSAVELVRMGQSIPEPTGAFLSRIADRACGHVGDPDEGIWEMRRDRRRYTYSQMMLWMALDRAVALAEQGEIRGDVERWRQARTEAGDLTRQHGFDPDLGAFTIAFDEASLDAANLLMPVYRFVDPDDARMLGTIHRTRERLVEDGLVYRYKVDDGLEGPEGAFVLCSFWLVDALTLAGRIDEAEALFDRLCGRVSHLGLLSEQIDPASGAFLGNFPQAFSHIGLINSACYLAAARGREVPGPTPLGLERSLF